MATRPYIRHLVDMVRTLPPVAAGVVYPCDRDSLQIALSGSFAGYLAPLLIGPEKRIRNTAMAAGLDISRMAIHDTADSPRAAGTEAAALARDGRVAALIKGNLQDGDLLAPIAARESGLRSERRLSHAYFVDLPGRPSGFLLADAQLNITPNLAAKKDIVLNTIDLAAALGILAPKVALLAPMDTITHAFPSTADATALRAMAAEGAFGRAVVDGPLTVDSALSIEAAHANGVKSDVAGHPDALIAPTMEAALLIAQTLTGLTGGLVAGIVLGARIPIVAPGRTDSMEMRMASCVLASLMVNAALRKEARREPRGVAGTPSSNAAA